MPEGKFHTICRTCGEEHFSEDYDKYEAFFKTHADEGHEIEMLNLASGYDQPDD